MVVLGLVVNCDGQVLVIHDMLGMNNLIDFF
jgi:ketopantoate hydroxymethyltransferase